MAGTELRWLFVGHGVMGAAALEALLAHRRPLAVLTAEPARGERPVVACADAHGLEPHHVERVGRDPRARWPALFTDLDVVVCCCWNERVPADGLRLPTHGWLNLHPSALPAWRGADPIAWQLLTRPARIGCSVHRMTAAHDEGPVVAEGSVAVASDDDRAVLLRRSAAHLGELAAGVLDDLAAGVPLRERTQNPEEATSCPPAGTVPLLEPRTMRADTAARMVRAFSPQPGVAVTALGSDRRFAVPDVGRQLAADEAPGTVAALDEHNATIAFLDRWVRGRTWRPGGAFAPWTG